MKEQREIFSVATSPLKRLRRKQSSGLDNKVESGKNNNDKLVANGNGVHLVSKKGIDIRFVKTLHVCTYPSYPCMFFQYKKMEVSRIKVKRHIS